MISELKSFLDHRLVTFLYQIYIGAWRVPAEDLLNHLLSMRVLKYPTRKRNFKPKNISKPHSYNENNRWFCTHHFYVNEEKLNVT